MCLQKEEFNMITSLQNTKVRQVMALQKKKERDKTRLFIVEGKKMIEEIPMDWEVREYFIQSSFYEKEENQDWLNKHVFSCQSLISSSTSIIADSIFLKMSDTETPQGILAMIEQREYDFSSLNILETDFWLLIEEMQDPGNLGTLIRTADAAGATGVILSKGTVDLYSPKVLRSTMGSVFHLPILTGVNLSEGIKELQNHGIQILAAHLQGALSPYEINLNRGIGILIGNEGRGLTEEVAKMADVAVKLPMLGKAESLNAAVAGSILLYEVVRQRERSKQ